jgi:hypothetical protein
MCWQCTNPDATRQEYLAHMAGLIEQYGWAVQNVERSGAYPQWAYTVGLSAQDEPELVVTGLPPERAAALLNSMASHVLHDASPRPGERIQLNTGRLLEIVELSEPSAHLHTATSLYGPHVAGIQLVYADDRGHWPWEVGYRGGKGGQPVLGPRGAPL